MIGTRVRTRTGAVGTVLRHHPSLPAWIVDIGRTQLAYTYDWLEVLS